MTKSRAGIGGSACAASIREGARLPLVTCGCRRCAALAARSGRRAGCEHASLGSSTCHGLPCGFAVITNRNPHSRRTGGICTRNRYETTQVWGDREREHDVAVSDKNVIYFPFNVV